MNDTHELFAVRLHTIDGILSKTKLSITSVESSSSALSNRVMNQEKHVEKAEERVSITEDSHSSYDTHVTAIKTEQVTDKN